MWMRANKKKVNKGLDKKEMSRVGVWVKISAFFYIVNSMVEDSVAVMIGNVEGGR